MYNIAVFMEDKNSQEITFRPDTNETQVSRYLYLPGFPDLVIQSDDFGFGVSRLIWSRGARELSFPAGGLSDSVSSLWNKRRSKNWIGLEESPPNSPSYLSSNTSSGTPNLDITVAMTAL